MNPLDGLPVPAVVIGDAVVPRPEATALVPRGLQHVQRHVAFQVVGDGPLFHHRQAVSYDHGIELPAVPLQIGVVVVRRQIQARLAQRQLGIVEEHQLGTVLVHQILDPVEELRHIRLVRLGADGVVLRIQFLRVDAIPPQAFAIGLGQFAIVRNARQRPGLVASLGLFIPAPGARRMHADSELHAGLAGELRPYPHNVFLRPGVHRIPRLIFRVEIVEVVMVIGHRNQELRASAFEPLDQRGRIPLLRLPFVDNVLEAELRGMPVFL